MSSIVRQLIDKAKNKIYPVGIASAVYMRGENMSVQDVLDDMLDKSSETKFKDDGSMVKTLASGRTITTVPNVDGTITETTKDAEGRVLKTKQVTFSLDGIKIVVNDEDVSSEEEAEETEGGE